MLDTLNELFNNTNRIYIFRIRNTELQTSANMKIKEKETNTYNIACHMQGEIQWNDRTYHDISRNLETFNQ